MTFLELCKRVRSESGVSGDIASVTGNTGILAKIVGWVKQAEKEVLRQHTDWKFLWTLSSGNLQQGVAQYTTVTLGVPSFANIAEFRVAGQTLRQMAWDYFKQHGFAHNNTAHGQPYAYTVRPDGVLVFNCAPLTALPFEVEFYREPTWMTEDGSLSAIPEKYLDTVVNQALMYYAQHDEAQSLYTFAQTKFDEALTLLTCEQLPIMDFEGGGFL